MGAKVSPGSGAGEGGCHRTGKGSQVATTMGNSKESSGAKRVGVWEVMRFLGRAKTAPAGEKLLQLQKSLQLEFVSGKPELGSRQERSEAKRALLLSDSISDFLQ